MKVIVIGLVNHEVQINIIGLLVRVVRSFGGLRLELKHEQIVNWKRIVYKLSYRKIPPRSIFLLMAVCA